MTWKQLFFSMFMFIPGSLPCLMGMISLMGQKNMYIHDVTAVLLIVQGIFFVYFCVDKFFAPK